MRNDRIKKRVTAILLHKAHTDQDIRDNFIQNIFYEWWVLENDLFDPSSVERENNLALKIFPEKLKSISNEEIEKIIGLNKHKIDEYHGFIVESSYEEAYDYTRWRING